MNEPERDVRLDVLDPATADPGYWLRFGRTIVRRAHPALAERRRRAQVTLEAVVFGWGLFLLPAVSAAVLAALLLARDWPAERGQTLAGVEEVLERPTGPQALPSFLHSGEDLGRDLVLLAVELR